MTKKNITEVYNFLATASMKQLDNDDKIALIKLYCRIKPVAKQLTDAIDDAVSKAREDGMKDQQLVEFVNKAVDDLAQEEVSINAAVLSQEAFYKLALSNDWVFAQIEELGEILIKKE